MATFEDFLSAVKNEEFDEKPVDLATFLYSDEYLGFPKLSDVQFKAIEAMTQIYRFDTLVELWGQEEADRLNRSTQQEIILMLGKGSGKNLITSIAFARIAYLLLCLKDPAKYYGKPPGDSIAMLNVAINAQQAKNVFFAYFKQRIRLCPWFQGKWDATADSLRFDKNVTAYSGHSEREAWEGYNFLIVVLDEIAGFATEAESTGDGHSRGKTAESIYKMYKASVSSRFAKNGKLVLLSFPRYKGDFITKRYEEVIGEMVVNQKSHTFKIHEDLPDGLEDNEITVEWEEDDIISYRESGVYAIKKPTWYVNPTVKLDDLKSDFLRDPYDALSRFACMPSEAVDAFFRDRDKIEKAFPPGKEGPFRSDWSWMSSFKPDKNRKYYLHVDLAYKHDRAAVAIASLEKWATIKYSETVQHRAPVVRLDAVRFWTPKPDENIDMEDVKNFIIELKMAGFPIRLVTFDRWNSVTYRQQLQSDFGIKTDLLSVAKPHYEDFSLAISEERIIGYDLPLLVDELLGLRVIRGNRVDHQRKGSKDLSDAVVGAIYNVINHEKNYDEVEIEVYFGARDEEEKEEEDKMDLNDEIIVPTPTYQKKKMPADLASFLRSRVKEEDEKEEVKSFSSPLEEIDLNIYMDGEKRS
jgi:hypothetical protein